MAVVLLPLLCARLAPSRPTFTLDSGQEKAGNRFKIRESRGAVGTVRIRRAVLDRIGGNRLSVGASFNEIDIKDLGDFFKPARDPPSGDEKDEIDAIFEEANRKHADEDFDGAIEDYSKINELYPCKEAHLNIGLCKVELDDMDGAVESYDKALDMDGAYSSAYYNKGLILEMRGELEDALDSFNMAIKVTHPRTAPIAKAGYLYAKGMVLDQLGRRKEALAIYDDAIELDSFDPDFWNNRGQTLAELGRVDEAIGNFKEALSLSENEDVGAMYNLAMSYAASEKPSESRRYLERAYNTDKFYLLSSILNWAYGAEALQERLEDERRFVLGQFSDATTDEEKDKWGGIVDVTEQLRATEANLDWMYNRILEAKGRTQVAYGTTFVDSWLAGVASNGLDSQSTDKNTMVVFGSSIGWQCFLGALSLGYHKCVGYEIMPSQVEISNQLSKSLQLEDKVEFLCEDALRGSITDAGLIWLNSYAWGPEAKKSISSKILQEAPEGSKVVSYEPLDVTALDGCPKNLVLLNVFDIEASWNPRSTAYVYSVSK